MCLVACGSADAYYHMGIHCWDMAGGAALVTEAGGVIMDISGKKTKNKTKLFTFECSKIMSCGDKTAELLIKCFLNGELHIFSNAQDPKAN